MYLAPTLTEREQVIKKLFDTLPQPLNSESLFNGSFASAAQYIEEPAQLENRHLRALLASVSNPAPGGGFLGAWPRRMLLSEWREHWEHILTDDAVRRELRRVISPLPLFLIAVSLLGCSDNAEGGR